jgi:hypothetical protein
VYTHTHTHCCFDSRLTKFRYALDSADRCSRQSTDWKTRIFFSQIDSIMQCTLRLSVTFDSKIDSISNSQYASALYGLLRTKNIVHYISARTIYAAIPLYSSIHCVLPRVCRRNLWVRILLSPSYFFFLLFPFPFPFSFFFIFFTLLCTNYHWWSLFVILSKYIHMRSCFEGFIKGIQWCNQNSIWFFDFWVTTFFS